MSPAIDGSRLRPRTEARSLPLPLPSHSPKSTNRSGARVTSYSSPKTWFPSTTNGDREAFAFIILRRLRSGAESLPVSRTLTATPFHWSEEMTSLRRSKLNGVRQQRSWKRNGEPLRNSKLQSRYRHGSFLRHCQL